MMYKTKSEKDHARLIELTALATGDPLRGDMEQMKEGGSMEREILSRIGQIRHTIQGKDLEIKANVVAATTREVVSDVWSAASAAVICCSFVSPVSLPAAAAAMMI